MTPTPSQSPPSADAAAKVLSLVDTLLAETHPSYPAHARLDSSLERDLGFDSLSRAELLMRAGAAFGVQLADEALSEVETPADLVRVLISAASTATSAAPAAPAAPAGASEASLRVQLSAIENSSAVPTSARTLVDVLAWHASVHPEREHLLFYASQERTEPMSYGGLLKAAQEIASGLAAEGLQAGEAVALMLPTSLEFFHAFYGILLAGGVPVPLYPPARMAQIEDHLRRQAGILDSCQAVMLITVVQAKPLARLLQVQVASLRRVVTAYELHRDAAGFVMPTLAADAVALLQYTSGSTGKPKGVVVTHANLLANIRAWTQADALALHNAARVHILTHCGEPDLSRRPPLQ